MRIPGSHPRVSSRSRILRTRCEPEVLARPYAELSARADFEVVEPAGRRAERPAGVHAVEEVPGGRLRVAVRGIRPAVPVIVRCLRAHDRIELHPRRAVVEWPPV